MASGQAGVIHQIHRLFGLGTVGGLKDAELLDRFIARDGEAAELAFAALVERHGPMVLRVCRSVLRDEHAAEDAFQATFLVLTRKAQSLWVNESLAPWLYGVAYRIASRVRTAAARRRRHERRIARSAAAVISENRRSDAAVLLQEEVARLPEKLRTPVVLCYLEGMSYEMAARHLGLPEGTVRGRLAQARDRLRDRLTRRGVAWPGELLVAGLGSEAASTAVPPGLVASTIQASTQFVSGKAVVTGMISASIVALSKGVMNVSFLTRIKMVVAVLLAIGVIAGGVGVLHHRLTGAQPEVARAVESSQPPTEREPAAEPVTSWEGLLSTQAKVSRKAYDRAFAAYRQGKVDLDKVRLWSERLMRTEMSTSELSGSTGSYVDNPKIRGIYVAAAEAHRDRMKQLEKVVRTRIEQGDEMPLNGTTAEYYRLEAEGVLLEYRVVAPTSKEKNRSPR